jgi:adenine-specific DNA-methyltransferase
MADSQTKLKNLLRELFQLDSADLDFGIYRIMNTKRSEIERFLDTDLLPQIKEAFRQYKSSDAAQIKADLDKVIQQMKDAGVDPELSPKVKEFREELSTAIDVSALENQVFSDLFNFFRRYYNEGDFLSLRRYKEGVYAIPYEGEEVKLYWANHDQYYIKSSEYLRDYAFKLADGRRVNFRLAAADTEKDNNKAANGNDRRFILAGEDAIAEDNGELVIRFEFRPDAQKRRQDALNAHATKTVLEASATAKWLFALAALDPSEADPDRAVLAKHLKDYTARNTFDYFIHKDVGPFLRRELDFFIKNEVMHLDDIESASVPRVEQYLSGIKVFRRIAHKIIDFVAQLENFQKKLWLKKKFVVETYYCIKLEHIPEEFYPEIIASDALRREWVQLYAIDELKADLTRPEYSAPLTVEFLKAHSTLVVDTRHFSPIFAERLLEAMGDLDDHTDGLLIRSENFQALSLMQARYRGTVKCIYIDPPYNTDASAIAYKNNYKDSSWLALIENRLIAAQALLRPIGITCIAIDDTEFARLKCLVDAALGSPATLGVAVVRSNPAGRSTPKGFAEAHEYAVFIAASESAVVGRVPRNERQLARYPERDGIGRFELVNFRKHGGREATREARPRMFYPIFAKNGTVRLPRLEWKAATSSWVLLEEPEATEEVVWPVNDSGQELRWKWGSESFTEQIDHFCARPDQSGKTGVYMKSRMNEEGMLPVTWWDDKEYSATEYGTNLLTRMFGSITDFSFPKALKLVVDCLRASDIKRDSLVLDFFAGSGTTGHAVINLNREDGGRRKFILIEMGTYFDTVLLPRIKKAIFSPEWKDGKPTRVATQECSERSPRIVKVIRLESYEDTLNNLDLIRSKPQQSLLDANQGVREDYTLRYMLDVESKDSQSLLNIQAFADPFKYTLNIATNAVGETTRTNVDLIETFNYLLGLHVKHIDTIRGFHVVHGTNPGGEKVLVIWRNVEENPNPKLDDFFQKQGYNTKDMEFDLVYVNGDNNLENLKKDEDTWKVRLIEEEFARLMFDVQDV